MLGPVRGLVALFGLSAVALALAVARPGQEAHALGRADVAVMIVAPPPLVAREAPRSGSFAWLAFETTTKDGSRRASLLLAGDGRFVVRLGPEVVAGRASAAELAAIERAGARDVLDAAERFRERWLVPVASDQPFSLVVAGSFAPGDTRRLESGLDTFLGVRAKPGAARLADLLGALVERATASDSAAD